MSPVALPAAARTADRTTRATRSSMRSVARQTWLLARNDLRQEMRDFELVATSGFFTLVVLVMFGLSFATIGRPVHPMAVPGMLWLGVAFVGALTLTRIFDREREADTLRALLAAPVERSAIYASKALVTLMVLLGCCVILVPGLSLLFEGAGAFLQRPGQTFVLVVLGCTAYASVGTLFAAGLATSSGKNVLLSVILYPLTSPALIFALVATRVLLEGRPDFATYLGQLAALDVILVVLSGALFESVLVGTSKGGNKRARSARSRRRG